MTGARRAMVPCSCGECASGCCGAAQSAGCPATYAFAFTIAANQVFPAQDYTGAATSTGNCTYLLDCGDDCTCCEGIHAVCGSLPSCESSCFTSGSAAVVRTWTLAMNVGASGSCRLVYAIKCNLSCSIGTCGGVEWQWTVTKPGGNNCFASASDDANVVYDGVTEAGDLGDCQDWSTVIPTWSIS